MGVGMGIRWGSNWLIKLYSGSALYSSNEQIRLTANGTTLGVYGQGGFPTHAELSLEGIIFTDEWYFIEFASTIHDSAGTTTVRINGVEVGSLCLSGIDTKGAAAAGVDRFAMHSSGGTVLFTDIYADDAELHGDCVVDALYPTADGFYTDWDPTPGDNWENVKDEGAVDGDSSYNETAVQASKDTFGHQSLVPRENSDILGVAVNLVGKKDWSGGRIVKPMIRITSGDYIHTADGFMLNEVYHGAQRIWDVNPALLTEWTEEAVNAAQFGYDLTTSTT